MTLSVNSTHYIDTDAAFADILPSLCACTYLAVDTEFIRVSTFYPRPALLQFSTHDSIFIVDPLALNDLSGLVRIFEDSNIVKVFHSAKEDLEVIHTLTGANMVNLFDTQVAHAFLTDTRFISYQNMVEHYLGAALEKGESRSNWLARPLSDAQLTYAAEDVWYLYQVYQPLKEILIQKLQYERFALECELMLSDAVKDTVVNEDYYLEIKLAWRLDDIGLQILKALCYWREGVVREIDSPRKSFLSTQNVFDIAKIRPKNMFSLSKVEQIKPRVLKAYGPSIIQIVTQVLEHPIDVVPEKVYRPVPPQHKKLLVSVRNVFHQYAVREGIARELIYKKNEVEGMINHYLLHREWVWTPFYQNWRQACIEPALFKVLKKL